MNLLWCTGGGGGGGARRKQYIDTGMKENRSKWDVILEENDNIPTNQEIAREAGTTKSLMNRITKHQATFFEYMTRRKW